MVDLQFLYYYYRNPVCIRSMCVCVLKGGTKGVIWSPTPFRNDEPIQENLARERGIRELWELILKRVRGVLSHFSYLCVRWFF
jgi:hypothetical protein